MKHKKTNLALAASSLVVIMMSTPTLAFAAEEGESKVGLGLLIPELTEFIPMLIGFIVLWIVLAKFAWKPFIGMIDKRTATIKDSLEKSEQARIESVELMEQQKAQLDAARQQAAQIIADAKSAAEMTRKDIETRAAEEAEGILSRARATIESEKQAALAELRTSVADLSVSVAGRLIGDDLGDAEHRRIVERYVLEAGSFNAN
jgi:F-type H+-transporting ATPase subunit b